MNHRILIVEPGVSRGALAAARSLGRAGYEVAIAGHARGPASWSKAAGGFHRTTAPSNDQRRFVSEIATLVAEHRYSLVVPAGDPELLVLSQNREEIAASILAPEHPVLLSLSDKLELCEIARAADLRTPDTRVATADTIARVDRPVLVKPRLHGDPASGGARVETEMAASAGQASAYAARIEAAGQEPLLQDAVDGDLMALAVVLSRDGKVLGLVQQRALMTWPLQAGISVRARTEEVDPGLSERTISMLRAADFHGIAEVQFIDPRRGAPYLIDVNPRLYGSLALAIAADVDLPRLAVADALGLDARPRADGKTGVRYQWLEGELRRALEDGNRISGTIRAFVFAPGAAHSISSLTDPRPLLRHLLDLVRRAWAKLARRDRSPGR